MQIDRRRFQPRPFIAACTALGAAVLFATVLARFFLAHNYQDFAQFYMGGVIARHGAWDSLYPVPVPGSERNAGEPDTSTMRPEYARLAADRGVPDAHRFMQAPPVALLFWPLTLFSYKGAHLVWTIASIIFGVIVAWQAGAVYKRLVGRPTLMQGLIVLLVAASPNMYQSCRMGQVSTLIGACIGLAILGLAGPERSGAGVGFGMYFATLVKYAGAFLAPVPLAMRRWRALAWSAALGLGTVALSVAIMGIEPWERWFRDIAPTLSRSHTWAANQSAYGLAVRLTGHNPPPAGVGMALKGASLVTLLVILVLVFTRRRSAWTSPTTALSACAALLAWMHIFSPIFWNHYYPYLFPLWGWLAWEALRSRAMAVAVLAIFALAWVPVGIVPGLATRLPELVRTHMLWSAFLLLAMSLWRLCREPAPRNAAHHENGGSGAGDPVRGDPGAAPA